MNLCIYCQRSKDACAANPCGAGRTPSPDEQADCKNCPQRLRFAFGRWEHVETGSVWCDRTQAEPSAPARNDR